MTFLGLPRHELFKYLDFVVFCTSLFLNNELNRTKHKEKHFSSRDLSPAGSNNLRTVRHDENPCNYFQKKAQWKIHEIVMIV